MYSTCPHSEAYGFPPSVRLQPSQQALEDIIRFFPLRNLDALLLQFMVESIIVQPSHFRRLLW